MSQTICPLSNFGKSKRQKAFMSKSSPKKHHYLASGKVMFRDPEDNIMGSDTNAVLRLDEKLITVASIGKAQQALQMEFHNRMGDLSMKPFDVFMYGFTYLGNMTDAQFQAKPDGAQMVEATLPGLTEIN